MDDGLVQASSSACSCPPCSDQSVRTWVRIMAQRVPTKGYVNRNQTRQRGHVVFSLRDHPGKPRPGFQACRLPHTFLSLLPWRILCRHFP